MTCASRSKVNGYAGPGSAQSLAQGLTGPHTAPAAPAAPARPAPATGPGPTRPDPAREGLCEPI